MSSKKLFKGAMAGYSSSRGAFKSTIPCAPRNKLTQPIGRDTDKDGVVDVSDCQPYNKKKQGVWHDIGKAVVRKLPARGAAGYVKKKASAKIAESEKLYNIRKKGIREAKVASAKAFAEEFKKEKISRAKRLARARANYTPVAQASQAFQQLRQAATPMMSSKAASMKPKRRKTKRKAGKKKKKR